MRRTSSILPVLMLVMASGCAARSGMGTAVVSQAGEVPCFGVESTVATRHGNPELQAISVTDQKGNPVWRFIFAPSAPGIPLAVGQCVQYGAKLPEMRVYVEPRQLEAGTLYTVMVNASVDDPQEAIHLYSARFCVVRQPGAAVRVHQIESKEGKPQAAVCGVQPPPAASGTR